MCIVLDQPTPQWMLDYDLKQLHRELRAYEYRLDLLESAENKIFDSIWGLNNTPGPIFTNHESMIVRSSLSAAMFDDERAVKWLTERIKQLSGRTRKRQSKKIVRPVIQPKEKNQ